MIYIILFIVLYGVMAGYVYWAKERGIVDHPNERSSHTETTVRGGGIIFPVAVFFWSLYVDHTDWYFVAAIFLVGFIGFLDDRFSLSQWPRLTVQSFAVVLVLWQLDLLISPVLFPLLGFILITGWLNTFNFMDGINGITAFYAFSVISGVYLFMNNIPEINISLIYTVILSLIVFAWFNARTKAKAFAGDVGSLSIGLILAYFITSLIVSTGRWEFILFVGVYGVDSVLTIIHRLVKRENIFEPHRSHLYQHLANEKNWHHLTVAGFYAALQFILILGLYVIEQSYWTLYTVISLTLLVASYFLSKALIYPSNKKLI